MMQYVYQFAIEHPILFTIIVIYLSRWRPIEISKTYLKAPDEYKLDE